LINNVEKMGFTTYDSKTGKKVKLAMQDLQLSGSINAVGALLNVRHVFRSGEKRTVEAIYTFMLPRDATVRRFKVVGENFKVSSQLMKKDAARKKYEEGIEAGSLSVLTQQYRDGVVNLSIGNLRPNETVVVYLEILAGIKLKDTGIRFRFPFTLAPGYHAKAITDSDGITGEISLPEDEFDDVILPEWRKSASNLHTVGFNIEANPGFSIKTISSPSHNIRVEITKSHATISLASEADVPNRDLVLEISSTVSNAKIKAASDDGKGVFAAVLPSHLFGEKEENPREIVFVVDRSGSMNGRPMEQAKRALLACLGALSSEDKFGIIAFDNHIEKYQKNLVKGSSENRETASQFIHGITARGGTELIKGIKVAFNMLKDETGDILVITDGQVMGTENILSSAKWGKVRIHCLGIGAASQDRFLTLLARQTEGVCRFVTPRERVDLEGLKFFSSIKQPLAENIEVSLTGIEGSLIPAPSKVVYQGEPLVVFGVTNENGNGNLKVSWREGAHNIVVPFQMEEDVLHDAINVIHGSRLITDLDSKIIVGNKNQKRYQDRLNKKLENLSEKYGLASRAMSLVAVVERKDDASGEIPHTAVVPIGMPEDVDFRSSFGLSRLQVSSRIQPTRALYSLKNRKQMDNSIMTFSQEKSISFSIQDRVDTTLFDLAALVMPDGGMPGQNDEERVLHSLLTLLTFSVQPEEVSSAFEPHMKRLLKYLEMQMIKLSSEKSKIAQTALSKIKLGDSIDGEWDRLVSPLLTTGRVANKRRIWRMIQKS